MQIDRNVGHYDNRIFHYLIKYFEGIVHGRIVAPRGDRFGWDPIFQPDGYAHTYAEMSEDEKNKISHRTLALNKLKQHLEK